MCLKALHGNDHWPVIVIFWGLRVPKPTTTPPFTFHNKAIVKKEIIQNGKINLEENNLIFAYLWKIIVKGINTIQVRPAQ